MKQEIINKDSRALDNFPTIEDYLKKGWLIKHVVYIEDQHIIQYILEIDTQAGIEVSQNDLTYYKDYSLWKDEIHNYKVRIHQLEKRLIRLLKFWPVKLFFPQPLSWDFEDRFNKIKNAQP